MAIEKKTAIQCNINVFHLQIKIFSVSRTLLVSEMSILYIVGREKSIDK